MPKNCSSDVEAAVSQLDQVFLSGNTTAIDNVKKSFGLSDLTNSIDFLGARKSLYRTDSTRTRTLTSNALSIRT